VLTKGAVLKVALFLGLAGTAAAQPVVSNVRIDFISHSEARIRYDLSASACFERARYGVDTGYETGSAGGIQDFHAGQAWCGQLDIGGQISGLAPQTLYHVCAQASTDGINWSRCVDTTFTTAPLPAVHPAPPIVPTWTPPASPTTTGYHVVTVAGDCHDLQSAINTAVANQPTNGTVINVPAQTVCPGPYQFPNDPQAVQIPANSSGMNLTTGVFTPSIVPAGVSLSNGQAVQFSTANGCLPGSHTQGTSGNSFNPNTNCNNNGPINPGNIYYIVNLTSNPTKFQVAATAGGTPLVPGDFGTSGPLLMGIWPSANSNWIVIRTATPDSQFCPPGVRCTGASWASKMAKLQLPGGRNDYSGGFKTGGLTHHVWLIGWEFTPTHVPLSGTTDPAPTSGFFWSVGGWGSSYIIIDRSYIHGLGFPDRLFRPFTEFSGGYMAIINSDLQKFDYWRPAISPANVPGPRGLTASNTGQVLTLTPGTYYLGVTTCSVGAPVTWTIAGGASNVGGKLYLDLNCNPTLLVPNGITATCIGQNCKVQTQSAPDYPRDGHGGYACGALYDIPFNNGTLGTPTEGNFANFPPSIYGSEGNAGMIAGYGPGPYVFSNLFVEGEGLLMHMDDSSSASDATGVTFQRTTWVLDQSKRPNGPNSDNFEYFQRNGPELKHGHQIFMDGNTFTGFWADVSGLGCAIVALSAYNQGNSGTPVNGGITDLTITNNTLKNSSCFVEFGGGVFNNAPKAPSQRIRIANNLVDSSNGWTQFSNFSRPFGAAVSIVPVSAVEDLVIDHNTIYDVRGPNNAWMHVINSPMEGVQITNNILWFNGDIPSNGIDGEGWYGVSVPSCGFYAKQMMDCVFKQGPGNPSYTFANNLIVPYYANSQVPNGAVDRPAMAAIYSGFPNVIVQEGAQPSDRLQGVGFANPAFSNFRLSSHSPYLSMASDLKDLGVDFSQLEAAQGRVSNVHLNPITQNSANLRFLAPDRDGCAADLSLSEKFPEFKRVANTGGGREQEVKFLGLKSGTKYFYRVLCAVEQPTGSFTTLPRTSSLTGSPRSGRGAGLAEY
jgi:hypothetical protein